MAARKLIDTLMLSLALASALALSGCSFLSSGEPLRQGPPPEEVGAAEAKKAVERARANLVTNEQLGGARTAAQAARAEAEVLKREAEERRNAAVSNGQNPDDPRQAPRAVIAMKTARFTDDDARRKEEEYAALAARKAKAEAELTQAVEALKAAERRANNNAAAAAQGPGQGTAETRTGWLDWSLALLPTALPALTVLALGGLFWWMRGALKDLEARAGVLVRGLAKKHDERFRELGATVSGLKDVKANLVELQAGMARLAELVEAGRKEQQAAQTRLAYAPAGSVGYATPADGFGEDPVDFPISAGSFHSRLGGTQHIVKTDPLRNLLVKDPEGRGQLVLVRDGGIPGAPYYIIPRMTRFQTKQDFYNYYEQLYDCARPGAGEVWINEPALADAADGGWRLREKGLLEVKA